MPKSTAILVGLKSVDPKAYEGWSGEDGCWGCELDVDNMAYILAPLDYTIKPIKTSDATRANVLNALGQAANTMRSGDMLVFYYSGHGGQQPDVDGDEGDGQDETLCVYDGEIIDDELNAIWTKFRSGVRIVMISDSCNSGTNYRLVRDVAASAATPFIPFDAAIRGKMKAQMIHFGGCRDGFSSAGYQTGGAFTMTLCDVWNGGAFRGNYRQFLDTIARKISGQTPQYNEYGRVSAAFRDQKPFSTSPPSRGDADVVEDESVGPFVFAKRASGVLIGRRFEGARGAEDTPAAEGTVAKSSYVRQVANHYLSGKFSADPGIRFGDAMYYLPTYREMQHLLEASSLDRRNWLQNRFDCDDFAYVLKAEASVHAYDSGDLRFGLCLGMMWGDFSWVNGYHAINWFIDSTGMLHLIEPQSDQIYAASQCEGRVSLFLA